MKDRLNQQVKSLEINFDRGKMNRKTEIKSIVEQTLMEIAPLAAVAAPAAGSALKSLVVPLLTQAGFMAAVSAPEIYRYFKGPSKEEKEEKEQAKKRASTTSGPANVAAEINRTDPSDYLGAAEKYRGRF